ncbi:hypothetical protein N7501_007197 [Penicillium viridicatum]|nr:hypothetical protein N7501_007197 [Penicillium viridicatum]
MGNYLDQHDLVRVARLGSFGTTDAWILIRDGSTAHRNGVKGNIKSKIKTLHIMEFVMVPATALVVSSETRTLKKTRAGPITGHSLEASHP